MNLLDNPAAPLYSVEAEQYVIGALLQDNDAIDRTEGLKSGHFHDPDHAKVYVEILRQISLGKRADVLTIMDALAIQMPDCLTYLTTVVNATPGSANVARYADIVMEKAIAREIIKLSGQMQESVQQGKQTGMVLDKAAAKIESLSQKQVKQEPVLFSDMLVDYIATLEKRMAGETRAIKTGFDALDNILRGGLKPGTLTVVAGRPAMGKSAFGLALARNVSTWGTSTILSMEMSAEELADRNIAALGKMPLDWLSCPTDDANWDRLTNAVMHAEKMQMFIDDQTSLNMLAIRNKARQVKRKRGLDMLVIDQLSFITGGDAENKAYELGEYTRGCLSLAKELQCAVVLLAQLNRDCEKRPDKRPMLSDLASSGSIEQDANNVLFLYRDEVYNPDSYDKGVCEIIVAKQRQGKTGMVGLAYIGEQTRFEDMAPGWRRAETENKKERRGMM